MQLSGNVLPAVPGDIRREISSPSQLPITVKEAPQRHDIITEATWPNLMLLCSLLDSPEFSPSHWQPVIDRKLVLQLLDRFDSEDPEERNLIKTVLYRIYRKFVGLRVEIRKQINYVLLRYIYETEKFNGVAELLKILGCIIDGFALPLKAEHKQFLIKVLIPLHKPKCLMNYHEQLTYCLIRFVEKDAMLAEQVVKGLLKFWPKVCTKKELLFLREIEDILEVTKPSQFAKIAKGLFKQIAKCIDNPHEQVVVRALEFCENDYILSLMEQNNETVMPLMFPALYRASKEQWQQETLAMVYRALGSFVGMNFKLFNRIADAYKAEREREKEREKERDELWKWLSKLELEH
ncbi:hypothetical protein HPB48_005768 [Haemaphysalis longicornis]|uniref:Serine/threonine protein phosphatase 2A regulatory subunit n=1 Tax=Haemaphysalis longicornis TaxID=44386 RepID=A0A9J6FAD2_HAELO|nr:hypothetical protein HPB48_005768 [Haemaphysalis longicornis]